MIKVIQPEYANRCLVIGQLRRTSIGSLSSDRVIAELPQGNSVAILPLDFNPAYQEVIIRERIPNAGTTP